MASITYAVGSNWGSGFIGTITVPGGSQGLKGWTVEFDAGFDITNIWGAEILSHVANHYVIGNATWDANVAAGAETSFGFQADTGSGGTTATGFTLNGSSTPPPPVPSISVADASIEEGDSGTSRLAFKVTLSQAATSTVTVRYTTADATAAAGSDYTAATGTLTFAPGQTSQTVQVKVSGDATYEANERLTLILSNPSDATLADGRATGRILNDDTRPALSIGDASFAEGSAGAPGHGLFTVSLSAPSGRPVTVHYATIDGTAVAGKDYVAQSGTLTFAPGQTQQTIDVTAIGNTVVAPDKTFGVALSSPSGATIADGGGAGIIVDDDGSPTLSIGNTRVAEGSGSGDAGWFSTRGNQIVDSTGNPVEIAGVNWFGFESPTMAPHGLWTRGYKDMMNQMVQLGFNTIRLPFSSEMLHSTAAPNGIDFGKNPDLQGLSALQILDKIVDYAGQVGLKIILDHHRSEAGAGTSDNGLWYDGQYSQAQWIADWRMLAERYADDPTVIGADLHNEPYNGTWGDGGTNDWMKAAELAGNAIGAANPNWLVFVEGIGTYQGQSYWWGGNLMGVKDHPVELDVANKLVYSAHDYPNSVYAQPWFSDPSFPANLPAKFTQMWGYIYQQNIAPVWLGEFGTKLSDPKDAPWLKALTAYLAGDFNNDGKSDIAAGQKGISWTYWAWNPNSGDTGGILADDWQTVNQAKLTYLAPIESPFAGSGGNSAVFAVTLSQPATQAITVDFHTVAGTATSADFTPVSGTLTFAPGEQAKTIAVPILADAVSEPNERFTVVLTNARGATIATATGTATIIDSTTSSAVPGVPSGLSAAATTSSSTLLSWNASTVSGGGTVTGYAIFENGQQIATTSDTRYTVTGLAADTTFQFAIAALDSAGASAPSSALAVHTTPGGAAFNGMFSPYIDMAMPVDADLSAISRASGIENFTLAFMLSSSRGIGWQGQGTIGDDTLANGSTILEQVQAIQAAGGNITISFGGAAGQEAALTAANAGVLQAEYQSVIDRYHITSIDFDIEGVAELNQSSLALRDKALVDLEAANPDLEVSFTLPVLPTGLDAGGLGVLQAARHDGVRIDLVNIMTMDYGAAVDNDGQMGRDAIDAAHATERQLDALGMTDTRLGITPIIGVNDVASEIFTLADARALVTFAQSDPRVGELSMWSVARDNGNSAGAHAASSDSSGIAQNPYQFSGILHQFDNG